MKTPAIWIIFLTIFIDILGFGLVIPILPNYVCKTLGYPEIVSGVLMGLFSLMQFLFSAFWGNISDKFGRKPILLISSFITATAYLIFAFTSNIWLLIISRLLAGFGSANIAAATAYIADITKPEERTKSMGKLGAAFGMGFIFGPPIGGFLMHKYDSIFPVGILAMSICLLNFILIYFILPESLKEKGKSSRPGFIKSNLNAIKELKTPLIGTILILNFLFVAAFSMMQVSSILLWENEYGISKKDVGWIFAFIGLVSSIVQGGLLGKISGRFNDRIMLYTGWTLMIVGLGLLPFVPKNFFLLPTLFCCATLAFANACISPVFMSLISKQTDVASQGKIMGTFQSYGALARIIGPVIAGGLYQIFYQLPLATGSAIMIFSMFGLKSIFKPAKINE
ncbi:MAG: MFS transporter [Bacteroidia bacterium]|nr:MFS transporter [Bacteroidia bacterium]